MRRKLNKWLRLGSSDRALLLHAWLSLSGMRLALWLLPFHRIPCARVLSSKPVESDRLAWAIAAASAFVPRSTCLVRALAAQRLFARYGHVAQVHIGVAKPTGQFAAHAWLEYNGAPILGASNIEYTPILVRSAGTLV